MSRGHHRNMYIGAKAKDRKKTIKRIAAYLLDYKPQLFFVMLFVILASVASVLVPTLFGNAIDTYIAPYDSTKGFDYSGVVTIAIIILSIGILSGLFRYLQTHIMAKVAHLIIKKIRKQAFDKLQRVSISYTDKSDAGTIMSKLTNDIDTLSNVLSESIVQLMNSFLIVALAATAMFLANVTLAFIAISVVPIMILITMFISKKTLRYFRIQQGKLGEINQIVDETLPFLKTVKLYNQEEKIITDFNDKNKKLRTSAFRANLYAGMIMPISIFINNLSYVSLVVIGSYMILSGANVTVGSIITITALARQFTFPVQSIAQLMNMIQRAVAGAERVFDLIDAPDEYEADSLVHLESVTGKIEFKNVTFGYDKNKAILKNISFVANSGETIAIVGPTGSGKTTLINLMSRFYDVDEGDILVDDKSIYDYSKASLRDKVGIVLQDTRLFSGSMKSNIKYGSVFASDEEVISVAKKTNADGFISRLPNAYDTEIKNGADNLSQGERQLVSISRTMLSDPEILILDEATSNVDTRIEANIQQSMDLMMQGRTSFVIAHRLQTIRKADKILVIVNGEIIENGSHNDLITQKGFYYEMYTAQFSK